MILTHPQIKYKADILKLAPAGRYAGNYVGFYDGDTYKIWGDYDSKNWVVVDSLPSNVALNAYGAPLKIGVINNFGFFANLINGLLGRK